MAKTAPYFPFYVDDWLDNEAIFDVSLECEGAYIRLLAAMWKRKGFIPNKDNWCCNILRCKPAKWRKIRITLVDAGLIKIENEIIFNERLLKELNFFKEKCEKNEENANKRWSKENQTDTKKTNKINDPTHAVALGAQCHTDTDTDTDTEKKKEDVSSETLSRNKNLDLANTQENLNLEEIKTRETYMSRATGILDFMNEKLNRNFKAKSPVGKPTANAEIIIKLFKAGYTDSNLRQVTARKKRDWDGTDMEKFLRPETLFRKSKFEGYLAECVLPKNEPEPEPIFDEFPDDIF